MNRAWESHWHPTWSIMGGVGAQALGQLITDLGAGLDMFYAWQYGMGCMKPLPKEQVLQCRPRSPSFVPILAPSQDPFQGLD